MELVNDEVLRSALVKQTGVSVRTLLNFGAQLESSKGAPSAKGLLVSAQFLHKELPVRLAHRLVELASLPHGLSEQPSIRTIAQWYATSYNELQAFPVPMTAEQERAFTALLGSIYDRHAPTMVAAARGIFEFKRALLKAQGASGGGGGGGGTALLHSAALPRAVEEEVQRWLDVFFTSRLGIRLLISQHIALHEPREGHIGVIQQSCRVADVVQAAMQDCAMVCERRFGECPDLQLVGAVDLRMDLIPMLLHHVTFELLKNAARAVVERHSGPSSLPPIRVIIGGSGESEDLVVKIADEGGGIPRSGMRRLFSYFFSTATPASAAVLGESPGGDGQQQAPDFSTDAPMAGLGMGLPLSRLYARFLGGELSVLSMEGFGTDAWVHLPRLGNASEPISECGAIAAFAPQLASAFPAGMGGLPEAEGGQEEAQRVAAWVAQAGTSPGPHVLPPRVPGESVPAWQAGRTGSGAVLHPPAFRIRLKDVKVREEGEAAGQGGSGQAATPPPPPSK